MTVLARPAIDEDVEFERVWLDDRSWVDVARGWLTSADALYRALLEEVRWRRTGSGATTTGSRSPACTDRPTTTAGPYTQCFPRWTSRRGRPVVGGNYRDPRNYSR